MISCRDVPDLRIYQFIQEYKPITSSPQLRLEALKKCKEAGLRTYVFLSPMFPFITEVEEIMKISNDYASMHDVILHVKNNLSQNYKYIILLQPTSPLRKINLINESIKILNNKKNFDSLIHLIKDSSFTGTVKNKIWRPEFNYNKRSQDINKKYIVSGNLYVYRASLFSKKIKLPKKTYPLISSDEKWIDIDCKEDFEILNFYLKEKKTRKILLS